MPRRRKAITYHGKDKDYIGKSITWERMKELEYFCARYNEYRQKYQDCHGLKGFDPDEIGGSSGIGHPTESSAAKALYWRNKMEAIEQCALKAAPEIYQDLLFALTHRGTGYAYLAKYREMPCGKKYYYRRRDDFFVILDDFLKRGIQGT